MGGVFTMWWRLQGKWLLLASLISAATAKPSDVTLTSSPGAIILDLTSDLALTCRLDIDFTKVISLKMSKDGLERGRRFTEIASITASGSESATMRNTPLTGQVAGSLRDGVHAWLAVEIANPGKAALGKYRCEGFGVDSSGHIQTVVATADVTEQRLSPAMLKGMLKQTMMEKGNLESELSTTKSQLADAEKNITDLSSQLTDATNQCSAGSLELEYLKATHNSTLLELAHLKRLYNTSSQALEKAKTDLSTTSSKLQSTKDDLKSLILEVAKTKTALNSTSFELNETKTQLNASMTQYGNLVTKCGAAYTQLSNLTSKCNSTSNDLTELQLKYNSTKVELGDVKLKYNSTAEELGNLRQNCTSTSHSLTYQRLLSLGAQLTNTKTQLATVSSNLTATQHHLSSCQVILDRFQKYKGHRYLLGPGLPNMNVTSYVNFCQSQGGYLAEINDWQEWGFVKGYLQGKERFRHFRAVIGMWNPHPGRVQQDDQFQFIHSKTQATFFEWDGHATDTDLGKQICVHVTHEMKMVPWPCWPGPSYRSTMYPLCEIPE